MAKINPDTQNADLLTFWHGVEILSILAFCGIVYLFWSARATDVEDFFIVRSVDVTDAPQGEEHPLLYDRLVLKKFWADWSAKLYPAGRDKVVCMGNGRNFYETTDKISDVTLAWFMNTKNCYPEPGDYIVRTTWDIEDVGIVANTSNQFTITERP